MTLKTIILITVGIILTGSMLVPICSNDLDADSMLDVVIIDGQSNAQYWGWTTNYVCNVADVNNSDLGAPRHNLYYYGDETPTYYGRVYTEPTQDGSLDNFGIHSMYEGEWKIGSYGPALAKTLSERSGHDVLIIDVGVGAAPVQWLTSTGPGGIWAERIITDALSKVPEKYHVDMLGMVWAQGESDKNTSVDTYIGYFNTLYNSLNEKYGLEKVYIIKTRDEVGGNSITAQEQLAANNSNITIATDITDTFTTDNGYLRPDELHYSQQGRTLIGEILGEKIDLIEHPASNVESIVQLIPIFVIVAIVMCAVGLIVVRRTD